MADRRMFSKTIIDSDIFLDMPLSTQALYFHLLGRADDDGFLNNAKKILRMTGANTNDYDLLIAKRFILQFPDGICVIKHWRIHNYIRNDRYKETVYKDEKAMLAVKENGAYTLMDTIGIPVVDQMETQVRLGKDRLGKDSIKESGKEQPHVTQSKKKFKPPEIEEVKSYCKEKGYVLDAEEFIDFYVSKDWYIGKNKMKDWKAAVRNWVRRDKKPQREDKPPKQGTKFNNFPDRNYSKEDLNSFEQQILQKQNNQSVRR